MNIRNFDLNLLRVLDQLGKTSTTVAAAERLNLSQPAVSAALRRLRDGLNDPLFERKGQRLEPTSFCARILPDVAAVLEQVEQVLAQEVSFHPETTRRTFRLAASDFYADYLMPILGPKFEALAPNGRLQLLPLAAKDHVSSLERFQTDAMLLLSSPIPGWMRSEDVMESRFRIIARREHPVLVQAGVQPGKQIASELYCCMNHALYSPSGETSTWVDDALASSGHRRQVSMTLSTFHSLGRTVAGTNHLATVPELTAYELAKNYALEVYEHPLSHVASKIMLAWHYRNDQKAHHRWFRSLLTECVCKLEERVLQGRGGLASSIRSRL